MAAGAGLATFAGGGADVFFGAVGEVAGVSVGHGWVGVGIWFGVVLWNGLGLICGMVWGCSVEWVGKLVGMEE